VRTGYLTADGHYLRLVQSDADELRCSRPRRRARPSRPGRSS
jgi:hypothetical protein